MFGRKSQSPDSSEAAGQPDAPGKAEGKGRPTPSRKEAEAARRARVKPARTRKEKSQLARRQRADQSRKMQEAMKSGDERYLPQRDRGPVRRFIRDWVDARFTLGEILIPVLVVAMLFGFVGSQRLAVIGSMLTLAILLMTILNGFLVRFSLRRELKHRFPDERPWKGTTWYAVMRSMQLRFLRLPKPQRKIGEPLPDHYR